MRTSLSRVCLALPLTPSVRMEPPLAFPQRSSIWPYRELSVTLLVMAAPPTHRPPTREGTENRLAYLLWEPETEPPWPGVVIVHGAGSRKENHADFARLAAAQ